MKYFIFLFLLGFNFSVSARQYVACFTKSPAWIMRYQPIKPPMGCINERFSSEERAMNAAQAKLKRGDKEAQAAVDQVAKECFSNLCSDGVKSTWHGLYCSDGLDEEVLKKHSSVPRANVQTMFNGICADLKQLGGSSNCNVQTRAGYFLFNIIQSSCMTPDLSLGAYEVR